MIAIADHASLGAAWLARVRRLLPTGAAVQLRITDAVARTALLDAVPPHPALLLNGTPDEARNRGWNLHLSALRVPGADRSGIAWVTAAVHDLAEVRRAEAVGVDALIFSPVFSPSTKPIPGVGLDALASIVRATQLPVYALGGVDVDRARACAAAGAAGVAAVAAVSGPDPERTMAALSAPWT